MGTSKSYILPTGNLWREAKIAVSSIVRDNGSIDSIGNAVKKYYKAVRENGGNIYKNKQKTVTTAAERAAGFINLVHTEGLTKALEHSGLVNLIDKSLDEIFIGLIDYFSGNGSLLDEAVVRDSMCELMNEIFKDILDINKVEEKFKNIDPQEFIMNFIIKCIQKDFLTSFSEKILSKCKNSKQHTLIQNNIKEFIKVTIKNRFNKKEIVSIDWNGKEIKAFITKMYDDIIDIFLTWSDSLD